jgi:hypothetical protein
VVGGRDGGGAGACEVEKDVRDGGEEDGEGAMKGLGAGKEGPGRGDEEEFGDGEKEEEEDLTRTGVVQVS